MAIDHFAGAPRTNRERMLAGDLRVADDPANARPAQRAVRLQEEHRARAAEDQEAAVVVLAELPGTLDDNVWLGTGVIVCPGVSIGDDTVVGAGSVVARGVRENSDDGQGRDA
ncbi:hypothetical protein [Puerhibacterium sp. TATVAM-FAB25]|uniref:hypothetical protein n=1 Tax=Puerhibacterium sp. TATVAM-FAB25 TaxID=3093699 RepID=UPI00397E3EB1